MDELLREILGEIKSMQADISSIKSDITSMKSEMASMKNEMASMKSDIASIKSKIDTMEGRLDENTEIVLALRHASEVQTAQYDNLLHATSRIEGDIKELRSDLSIVEKVTIKNWDDISKLKAIRS